MQPSAANCVAGSTATRLANGKLRLATPQGVVFHEGANTREAVDNALADEPAVLREAVHKWLTVAGIYGSGFYSFPINNPCLAPRLVPRGSAGLRT